jgi:hypothetical protein
VGDDRGLEAEDLVAVRVVAVEVGVEDEPNGLVGDASERRLDLRDQCLELVVDEDDPVVAHRHADVPAREAAHAVQHVDGAGDLLGLDLDLAPVPVLGGQARRRDQCQRKGAADHQRRSSHIHVS